jgi:hypothetical protein
LIGFKHLSIGRLIKHIITASEHALASLMPVAVHLQHRLLRGCQ